MQHALRIQPLASSTLAATIELLDTVFPDQKWWERASWALTLSLLPKLIARPLLAFTGIYDCRYWVAVDAQEQVAGVTGLYVRHWDPESLWLGWTCVDQRVRGQGIGRQLVDFAIAEANRAGVHFLKLYTTDLADQEVAVQTYERRGFQRYRSVESRLHRTVFRYLYYRLNLGQ